MTDMDRKMTCPACGGSDTRRLTATDEEHFDRIGEPACMVRTREWACSACDVLFSVRKVSVRRDDRAQTTLDSFAEGSE